MQLSLTFHQIWEGSILQYFRPSLNFHLPLRSLFCLFLSGRFTCRFYTGFTLLHHQRAQYMEIYEGLYQSFAGYVGMGIY